ncbi:hypothetical protein LS73_000155 [Helicobacter muridarum]|uniref:Uncharacterized protein n=1 Tax=Helicobacter muridarum TaxID=216 RepID=A0A099TVL3_9HELI|nr:hypothetical protein [Helicobacter muridarum]TLE01595.1 hypothetical protein LS73_000155 [Helicobacter muridarum]STQ86209.1 Uncharacterised protein [Helicobacter muridarum]
MNAFVLRLLLLDSSLKAWSLPHKVTPFAFCLKTSKINSQDFRISVICIILEFFKRYVCMKEGTR